MTDTLSPTIAINWHEKLQQEILSLSETEAKEAYFLIHRFRLEGIPAQPPVAPIVEALANLPMWEDMPDEEFQAFLDEIYMGRRGEPYGDIHASVLD